MLEWPYGFLHVHTHVWNSLFRLFVRPAILDPKLAMGEVEVVCMIMMCVCVCIESSYMNDRRVRNSCVYTPT